MMRAMRARCPPAPLLAHRFLFFLAQQSYWFSYYYSHTKNGYEGAPEDTNICVTGMCTIFTTNAIAPMMMAPTAVAHSVLLNSARGAVAGGAVGG